MLLPIKVTNMSNDLTFYDRQTLEYWLRSQMSLQDIGKAMRRAHTILSREIARIESLPGEMFKTMTFDNGGEGARHTEIRKEYGVETYFCHPFASWQKGGVENANKLIRQYLPRSGQSFRIH